MFRFVYHQVLNQVTYYPHPARLSQGSHSWIVFKCPYAYARRVERCIDYLAAAVRRDVCVCVLLQTPKDEQITEQNVKQREATTRAATLLLGAGAHLTYRPDAHDRVAVYDEENIADGSMNFMSQSFTSKRINLFESPELARHAVVAHGLNLCDTCGSMRLSNDRMELLRLTLAKAHEQLDLLYKHLAINSNVSRTLISSFEQGHNDAIGLDKLEQILFPLNMRIRCVPNFMLAQLDQRIFRLSQEPEQHQSWV